MSDRGKKSELKGKLNGKAKLKNVLVKWIGKVGVLFLIKVLPIFVSICVAYLAIHWIADLFDSKNNPSEAYKIVEEEEGQGLSGLIEIAGNKDDGYYLAYKEGFEEKVKKIQKSYDDAGYQFMTTDVIKATIMAELYTQYPNLGGKIGNESKTVTSGTTSGSGSTGGMTGNFDGVLCWPTLPTSTQITSYFGFRAIPIAGATADHGAIDIAVPEGQDVYACQAGTVELSQMLGTAGNMVQINHGNGYVTKYMHNSQLLVSAGQQVEQGQLIAKAGTTGASTGPHIHFQIEKNGVKVDPLTFKYNNNMGDGSANGEGFYSGGSTTSNENKNNNKESDDENKKVDNINGFLFIGDSITVGLASTAKEDCTFKGVVGVGANYWITHFSELENVKDVKGINVFLGTNDYNGGKDKMIELLEKLHNKYPDVTIYVDKLLPDTSGRANQAKREEYMKDIESFCQGKSYMKYIDITKDVEMASDGIHPTATGYKKLIENLKAELTQNGTSNNTNTSSSGNGLTIGKDTGKGTEGFQGAIRIRRIMPNKEIGSAINTGSGSTSTVTDDSMETSDSTKDIIDNKLQDGNWSIYVKNLTNNSGTIKKQANKKMQSASLIKLFIMATAYQEMADNGTNIDKSLINKMITVSDNDSTNILIDKLGMEKINKYIKDNGYSNTEINRKMLQSSTNGDNYTSTLDVVKILEKIYNGKCVNKKASEEMLEHLKGQNAASSYEKIRKDIPEGAYIGGKTGELNSVENDAAILTKDGTTYIMAVMSSDLSDTSAARANIAELSKTVYDSINEKSDNKKSEDDKDESENDDESKEDTEKTTTSTVNSKVYDLKYMEEKDFDELVNSDNTEALDYYTLDGNWNLIVATWSVDDGIVSISKNKAINYKAVVEKYTTPFEYLLDYYIDIKDRDFIMDFINLILKTKIIIAVQDNVTTVEVTDEYGVSVSEDVNTKLEVTYVDTWFVKFSKETNYVNGISAGGSNVLNTPVDSTTANGINLTGTKGEKIGDFVISAYCNCSICCGPWAGMGLTASGLPAQVGLTVASNTLPRLSYIMFNNHIYQVQDTGGGLGNRIDLYMSTHEEALAWGLQVHPVYAVSNVSQSGSTNSGNNSNNNNNNNKDNNSKKSKNISDTSGNALLNVTGAVSGDVEETITTSGKVTTRTIEYTYDSGKSKKPISNEKKFIQLFRDNPEALDKLKPKWLITIVKRGERTANFTDLTKYLLYKLTGDSYGVTKFDFSIYKPEDFKDVESAKSSISSKSGLEQFIRYLDTWEGSTPLSADGKRYVIATDGYGHPTVGHGIDLINGGYDAVLRAAGYPTSIGAEVDKDFIDGLRRERVEKDLEYVEQKFADLDLKQYQKYVIVSRMFNAGKGVTDWVINGKDFRQAYKDYWNPSKDDAYKQPANDSIFSHPLYTQHLFRPNTTNNQFSQGLENRRKSEFILFKTGYYDKLGEYYEEDVSGGTGDAGGIIDAASKVHKYMETNSYNYTITNIGALPTSVKNVKSTNWICCASYVSWAIYEAGYSWMEQCSNINYCPTLWQFLESKGVKKIMNPTIAQLEPGDVVFFGPGGGQHVNIYAGNMTWYDGGCDNFIKSAAPVSWMPIGPLYGIYCCFRFN